MGERGDQVHLRSFNLLETGESQVADKSSLSRLAGEAGSRVNDATVQFSEPFPFVRVVDPSPEDARIAQIRKTTDTLRHERQRIEIRRDGCEG